MLGDVLRDGEKLLIEFSNGYLKRIQGKENYKSNHSFETTVVIEISFNIL